MQAGVSLHYNCHAAENFTLESLILDADNRVKLKCSAAKD